MKDWQGATTAEALSPACYYAPDSVLISLEKPVEFAEQVRLGSIKSFQGKGDFTLDITLATTERDAAVAEQVGAYALHLKNGKPSFHAGSVVYNAETIVNDGQPHRITCVRERNGMVKVYVDGTLQGTAYDKHHTNESLPAAPILLGQPNKTFSLTHFELREGAM